MFKYIGDILKQFTPHQRMTALIVLLISIVSITYIESVTKTPAELTKQVSIQRKAILKDQVYITDLSKIVSNLNDSLLASSQECNEKAMTRERVYNQRMVEQQQYLTKAIEEVMGMIGKRQSTKIMMKQSPEVGIIDDSLHVSNPKIMISAPVQTEESAPNLDRKIFDKLNKIKKNIKK